MTAVSAFFQASTAESLEFWTDGTIKLHFAVNVKQFMIFVFIFCQDRILVHYCQ